MIRAHYDPNGNILLDLKLIGNCKEKKVDALLDTGFSAALAVPVDIGCEIGLEGVGNARVIVASGEAIPVPIFIGKVEIGTEIIECIYIVLPGSDEVLLGMEVLKEYNVQFHGAERIITIKKGAVEAAEGIEETMIEPSVVAPIISPAPSPPLEITPAPVEPILKAEGKGDRMQALKETLREVVPR